MESRPGRGAGRGGAVADLPRLHVIAGDAIIAACDYRERLGRVVEAGGASVAVHLRARTLPTVRLLEVSEWLVSRGRETGSMAVVNDRLDVALAAGAGGVHLREDSLPAAEVRAVAERAAVESVRLKIGRSIHRPRQAATVTGDVVDYLVLGAVYATPSHPGRAPLGPGAVADAVRLASVPVLAIGGITPATLSNVVADGAYGAVVLSGVWGAEHPSEAVNRYLEVLCRSPWINPREGAS